MDHDRGNRRDSAKALCYRDRQGTTTKARSSPRQGLRPQALRLCVSASKLTWSSSPRQGVTRRSSKADTTALSGAPGRESTYGENSTLSDATGDTAAVDPQRKSGLFFLARIPQAFLSMHPVGAELKRARARLGLSAEQIGTRTKVQLYKIEALENGNFDDLPGGIYLDGIVRAYANEVALDPETLIQQVRVERAEATEDSEAFGDFEFLGQGQKTDRRIAPVRDHLRESTPELFTTTEPPIPPTYQELRRTRRMSRLAVPLLALLASAGWSMYLYEIASRPARERTPVSSAPARPPARPVEAGRGNAAPAPDIATPTATNERVPLDTDAGVTPRGSSGTAGKMVTPPPPEPVPAPTASAPPATPVRNLSGSWRFTTSVQSSSVTDFVGLRLGYDIQFEQAGNRITGSGRKITENGAAIAAQAQTPISMAGTIAGDRVTLTLTEDGTKRQSQGKFVLLVDGEALRGRFSSTAAQSSGLVEGHRVAESR